MEKVVLIRYGEIFLKGKNFGYFEKLLKENIEDKIKDFGCELVLMNKRLYVKGYEERQEKKIVSALSTVFGLTSVSPAVMLDTSEEAINDYVSGITLRAKTFRVSVNRADKRFPLSSIEYSAKLGGIVLKNNPQIEVDLHTPEATLSVDIRENGKTFVFTEVVTCVGGMPVGSSGTGMLLLSGGIDSPVAGYMMAKRGMRISALHFHSYPYTSEMAKEKVVSLAKLIKKYTGSFKLYVCSFTKIQEEIHRKCNSEFMITIMRRIMYRIAERLSTEKGVQSIITGENLGQVASQTVESMTVTNDVVKNMPIFRPLIAFDKGEITEISRKIDTYETSILPYEDCCTVFLPKHPVIKPKKSQCEREESKLDIEGLIKEAMEGIEVIEI